MPERQEQTIQQPGVLQQYRAWLVAAAVVAVCGYLAYVARTVFTPLLAALAIAYIFNPVVNWFDRRGIPRLAVIIILFLLVAATVTLLGGLVLFKAIEQITQLATWLSKNVPALFERIDARFPQVSGELLAKLKNASSEHLAHAVRHLTDTVITVAGSAWAVVNLLILIPLYTFFFLWRFDRVLDVLAGIVPTAYRDRVIDIAQQIDHTLASFFRGRLVVCAIVGAGSVIGFIIVGVPFALPLGILIGVLNLVPFLATIVGLPITLVICYLYYLHIAPAIYALVVFAIVQALDNFVLSPMLGKTVGLHPITTVVVLLIGSELAGVFGLLVAIPAAAIIKNLFRELVLPQLTELTGPTPKEPPTNQPGQSADADE